MKIKKINFWVMILGIVTAMAAVVPYSVEEKTYEAYLSGSMNLWERSVRMASEQHESLKNRDSEFALLKAEYGLLNATMKDENEEMFEKYIEQAFERGEGLAEVDEYSAESKAILSGLTGLKIAYSPWKGMFLGGKSSSLIADAINEDPESPLVQQLFANYKNFTPEMWGGDPETAITAYKKAISLYETQQQTETWMYLDAHAWLGIVERKQGRDDEARAVWTKAVEQEPDFAWVKLSLLPSLD